MASYVPALALPSLPAAADDSAVIALGERIDPQTGRIVEGFKIIDYKPGYGKSANARKPGGGGTTCYAFLANGARWKGTENYLVDPTNSRGLDGTVVNGLLAQAADGWDNQVAFEVFGNEVQGAVDAASIGNSMNGRNEFAFGDSGSPGAIAVTVVWGVFYGPPSGRELVEWDMLFDDGDFDWSAEASGVAGKMDFLNIAAHEVGHAAGMGHPSNTCTNETMYAYADYGETIKRDLNTGDVLGIKALYK
ncbi:MAG: matrixin family metalloprotease [Patescibacteria group bacterium]